MKKNNLSISLPNLKAPPTQQLQSILDYHIDPRSISEYLYYSDLIKSDKSVSSELITKLEKDPRVSNLIEETVDFGTSSKSISLEDLAMWFLKSYIQHGREKANRELNKFLDDEYLEVLNTLWLIGVEIDKAADLGDGVELTPTNEMPDSVHKLEFSKTSTQLSHPLLPKAALTKVFKQKKIINNENPPLSTDLYEDKRNLKDISLLINALNDASCLPHYSAEYTPAECPMNNSIAMASTTNEVLDVLGRKTCFLKQDDITELTKLIVAFKKLKDKEKRLLRKILFRLAQAKRRDIYTDKLLDLGIALEMALLNDDSSQHQLSLTIKLRGSWLLGTNTSERKMIFKTLGEIYKYRSQVAHNGEVRKLQALNIVARTSICNEYTLLASRIVRNLIFEGFPTADKWENLILGDS